MILHPFPRLAAAAAALAALSACTAPQAAKPNILVLLMDTLRADRLGCYGYGKATSPIVDRLAERGTLFTRCYAPSDYTQASTASLFTGQYPLAHGYVNSDYVLEEPNLTMAEIFRDAGYTTAAFIANGLAGRKYRMDQGFHEHFEKNRASAFELAEAAREFIGRQSSPGSPPFLAYLHFLDVHDPHRIPAADFSRLADPAAFVFDMQDTLLLESMAMRAWWSTVQKWRDEGEEFEQVARYFEDYSDLYDSSIAYWDEAVGSILESLVRNGLDRNTVIVITSDHGEQLLEHGFFGHANSGYDVGLHVPLVIFDPADDGSRQRISRPVSLIDVLPTLLARAGMPVPEQVQGRTLWPFSDGSGGAGDGRPIYSEGTFFANRPVGTMIQTLREGRWKLILDRLRDSKELYDLRRDPGESRNLLGTEAAVAARLYGELQRHYNRNLEIFNARQRSEADRTTEKLRELRSLGYITPPGPRRHRLPTQYFPMAGAGVHRFGPFGDEEHLHRFSDHLDLTRPGLAALGQIIRGCSQDPAGADGAGLWFDRRSTFLLYNDGAKGRVRFEAAVDPGAPAAPVSVQVEFNDAPGEVFPVQGTGGLWVEAALPDSLRQEGYFYAGLLADSRFVLRAGPSPRTHRWAALKIRGVQLLE